MFYFWLIKEVALAHACVLAVDFDHKASPYGWSKKTLSRAPKGKGSSGIGSGDRIPGDPFFEEPISEDPFPTPHWPNDPYLLSGAQWELQEEGGVQAQQAWKASIGTFSSFLYRRMHALLLQCSSCKHPHAAVCMRMHVCIVNYSSGVYAALGVLTGRFFSPTLLRAPSIFLRLAQII